MLNVPLDTIQVISGTLFPENLLANTVEKSGKPGDAKYITLANTITKSTGWLKIKYPTRQYAISSQPVVRF